MAASAKLELFWFLFFKKKMPWQEASSVALVCHLKGAAHTPSSSPSNEFIIPTGVQCPQGL